MNIQPKITPVLDPGFVPAVLWNQAFEAKARPPIPLLIKWTSL